MLFKQVISYFQNRAQEKARAEKIYHACVAQARTPALYQRFGLADTVQMRFEFITAHLWLVMRPLRSAGKRALVKAVAAHFFSDMDAALREAGEGDLAVPKRIKTFAQAFYGRLAAYDRAIDESNLAKALGNNLPSSELLNSYFIKQLKHFEGLPLSHYYEDSHLFNQNAL